MIELIEQIRQNLRAFAYPNEASISHGIVTPILQALGWNTADPKQLVPEYTVERQRVDFALLGAGKKPAVFIEVKGQGLAAQGDKQLFGYAFHSGVPLCVLTDGAEWSFYLPGGQGSYEDRRVYRLQLDERSPEECEQILTRYLQRQRVCSGEAYEEAQRDHKAAASRREAIAALPLAWSDLLGEPDGTLMSLVRDKAESLCGYPPTDEDVTEFLVGMVDQRTVRTQAANLAPEKAEPSAAEAEEPEPLPARKITATLLGRVYHYENASDALTELLRLIVKRDPSRIPDLAARVRVRERSHIASTRQEIHAERPSSRTAEIAPGWFVNLNLSNKQKKRILDAACVTYELPTGALTTDMPNT